MITALWILLYLALPAGVLLLCGKVKILDTIGPVVVCYIIGIVLGNIGILPENIFDTQDLLTTLTVPLALPLIFFSMDLGGWKNQAGVVVKAFVGAFIAIIIASALAFIFFREVIGGDVWKVAGMLIGVYTGGTPNMASIGTALQVDSSSYLAVHGADVVVGGILLFTLISFVPNMLRRLLPLYQPQAAGVGQDSDVQDEADEQMLFTPHFTGFARKDLLPAAKAVGLSVIIFGVGGGFSFVVPEAYATLTAILIITTLGVIGSRFRQLRNIRFTFQTGHYLLLVFSLVVSSMADVRKLTDTAPIFMLYIAVLLVLTLIIHTIISKFLKVDADTHLITATALIYSPPFVPVVAAALKNKRVIMAGMISGIAGWVIGNYLGIGFGYLLYGIFY